MISISKGNIKKIIKYSFIAFFSYLLLFVLFKVFSYYKNSFEKDRLTKELIQKKEETRSLKQQVLIVKNRTEKVKKSYIKKDELSVKVKDIFKRMSILDYKLTYLDSKNMCIDRHILVTQLTAKSTSGLKAGEGILSYLGKIRKSESNPSIYFIDYVSKAKDK